MIGIKTLFTLLEDVELLASVFFGVIFLQCRQLISHLTETTSSPWKSFCRLRKYYWHFSYEFLPRW